MGTKGRQIVGMDVDELLDMLNKAFADEWLAYYQYWLGEPLTSRSREQQRISEAMSGNRSWHILPGRQFRR